MVVAIIDNDFVRQKIIEAAKDKEILAVKELYEILNRDEDEDFTEENNIYIIYGEDIDYIGGIREKLSECGIITSRNRTVAIYCDKEIDTEEKARNTINKLLENFFKSGYIITSNKKNYTYEVIFEDLENNKNQFRFLSEKSKYSLDETLLAIGINNTELENNFEEVVNIAKEKGVHIEEIPDITDISNIDKNKERIPYTRKDKKYLLLLDDEVCIHIENQREVKKINDKKDDEIKNLLSEADRRIAELKFKEGNSLSDNKKEAAEIVKKLQADIKRKQEEKEQEKEYSKYLREVKEIIKDISDDEKIKKFLQEEDLEEIGGSDSEEDKENKTSEAACDEKEQNKEQEQETEIIQNKEVAKDSEKTEENKYNKDCKNKKISLLNKNANLLKTCVFLMAALVAMFIIHKSFQNSITDETIQSLSSFCSEITLRKIISLLFIGVYIFVAVKIGCAYYYKRVTGRTLSRDKSKYRRDFFDLLDYYKDAEPGKMNENLLAHNSWKECEGVVLGKANNGKVYNIKTGKDGKNYFIFGIPGCGKTAGPIICTCLRWGMDRPLSEDGNKESNGSVFCIDVKNDIYKATHKYRKIKKFNLMNAADSCHFDPFDEYLRLNNKDDKRIFIERLAFNIIEDDSGDTRYFYDTALDFFNGICLYLLEKNENISFPEVIREILLNSPAYWIDLLCQTKANGEERFEEAQKRIVSKKGENEKNLAGAYSKLCQSCRKFSSEKLSFLLGNEKDKGYEYISPQMLEDGYDVYIQIDQKELKNYAALLSMIVQCFLNGFIDRGNEDSNLKASKLPNGNLRPIVFMLDEFAQLKTLEYETVASAFMTLRSRNVSIICALQSLSSITEMFDNEYASDALVDCVTTFAFLSIQNPDTREWASKLIGEKKVLKLSTNLDDKKENGGRSVSEEKEWVVAPEEFGSLKDDERGIDKIVVYSNGKYIIANKQYYFKD